MFDGMVATRSSEIHPLGGIYNEVPDRISDVLTLVGFSIACGQPLVGAFTGLLSVMTAYIRAVGAVYGANQCFQGPMAKPHRMFAVIACSALLAMAPWLFPGVDTTMVSSSVLYMICAGTLLTCIRRQMTIAKQLMHIAK
eukprot:CAMPEP_0201559522 /NCGR_PEP_ID=MMETSP0173_2-20130828/74672_1 /ASSEMBLY_ACC=CAM_ASM_000268 /TAXON_ID=218659 /ORGANISM="Vexillifera sp., Strain DIVA3 564/2" /LENGTH=139 /DNA_ID=CAMNT_0047973605 /DNA_START=317 /DNA_END=736 /DNA_ORIENTATION=-